MKYNITFDSKEPIEKCENCPFLKKTYKNYWDEKASYKCILIRRHIKKNKLNERDEKCSLREIEQLPRPDFSKLIAPNKMSKEKQY